MGKLQAYINNSMGGIYMENNTKKLTEEEKRRINEVKNNFDNKAYKKYMVRLRYDSDKELIDFIEDEINALKEQRIKNGGGRNVGITEVVKNALYEKMYEKKSK